MDKNLGLFTQINGLSYWLLQQSNLKNQSFWMIMTIALYIYLRWITIHLQAPYRGF
ncbi:MAG: hypothetical protein HKP48_00185 [Winogradskyella sp.]|uniref:hypothetical protein n=1 Tax=Winogradskyella sp. TaxID=1883156 RepID=UPI001857B22D|nr:hypothetical protein [Winogradskyella sp.]MBT8244669.1 hypothetical protein [Winogradskyella sp.]NNK21734.1 hypothetical protein [Winogradskyella sp.]